MEIEKIVAGLSSKNSEEAQSYLARAKDLLAQAEFSNQPEVLVPLLLAFKGVIDRAEDLEYAVVDQAYDLLIEHLMLNWSQLEPIAALSHLIAWHDQQMDLDGIVLAKTHSFLFKLLEEEIAPIVAGLKSADPEIVEKAIAESKEMLFYSGYIGIAAMFSPLLLALKVVVDKEEILDHSIVGPARRLLLDELWHNQNFLKYTPELQPLVEWYHRQEDSTPFRTAPTDT